MHQSIYSDLKNQIIQNKRRNVFKRIIGMLSVTVMFCTTYVLILPAITMEQKTFCGIQEHTHSEVCYSQIQQRELICTAQHLNIHTHAENCYGPEGRLICGQCDYVAHSHDSSCCNAVGELVCTLEERNVHVHDNSCYEPGETLPMIPHVHSDVCNVLQRGELICAQEELGGHAHGNTCYEPSEVLLCIKQEKHVHTESCYDIPLICTQSMQPHVHGTDCNGRGGLICTTAENHVHIDSCKETICVCDNAEENHTHGSECYSSKVICTTSENHSHVNSCYESMVVCGKTEGVCHSHNSACYGEKKLTCTEDENHVHSGSCYESRLVCTIKEIPGHAHGDECYEQITVIGCGLNEGEAEPAEPVDPVLVCREPAAQVHVHRESCFKTTTVDATPICGNTDSSHIHENVCYDLCCDLEEHTHKTACYSDPEADLETAETWEATFDHVELTGDWNEDVLAIATTQLGYTESAKNYAVWADDTTHGYTRYGQWYGSPYGDWCAMFVSFCLNYAEVEGMPLHWGVRPWIEELTELKLYHEAEIYTPKPGDLIFYDWEGDDLSDHVGFVAEIIPETEYEPAQLKALEGNSSNCVQYVYYEYDDNRILGYSELPDNIEIYSCGVMRHVHNEYCHDTAGNLTCLQVEHLHTDLCEPRDALYCGMDIHSHTEICFDESGELICQIAEHTHNETCYIQMPVEDEPTYYCDLDEHIHTEACVDENGELFCDIPEHTHAEECSVAPMTYYCGLEEHTHIETCFDEAGELVCEIPDHIHTEECTTEPAISTYYCGQDEHTHTETCFNENGELLCEIPEHTHAEECSVETMIYYCGRVEHTHDDTCHDEAGELVCEIPEHNHTEECTKMTVYLCGMEEHIHADECYSEDGSLICQLHEHTHTEQCVIVGGYICGLEEHTHNENCYDAQGNFICTLEEHMHTDACKAQNSYACGLDEHAHGEGCYDEEGNLICEIPEHIHTSACVGRNLYYSDMQIRVHAVIRGVEDLPQKLSLQVRKVIPEQDPQSFGDMQVAVSEQISTQDQYLSEACFYDMYLLSEGEIYNLPETASITVTMEFEEPVFTPDAMTDAVSTQAFMLTPEGGMQLPPDLAAGKETSQETEEVTEPTEESLVEDVISNITSSFRSILTPALALDDLDEIEQIPDDSEIPKDPGMIYNVSGLSGENYGNPSGGITSITFTTNRIGALALATTTQTVEGTYWTRVTSTSELTSDGVYMIISAEGNYALRGATSGNNYTAVRLQTVKGNTDYYTITLPDGTALSDGYLNWTFSGNGSSFTIQNKASKQYLGLSNSTFISSNSATSTLSYVTPENCWRIKNGSYYLRNKGDSGNCAFYRGTGEDSNITSWNVDYYYTAGMLIFKLSDVSALDVPNNVVESNNQENSSGSGEVKPEYSAFKNTSSGKEGSTAVYGCYSATGNLVCTKSIHIHDDSCYNNQEVICGKTAHIHINTVNGTYASDPSTSKIEANFRKSSVTENYPNDGKVMTDKSVIYGADDYAAFETYAPNTFSVTLSALGQAYKMPQEELLATPVDVVFVLDTSSSMSSDNTSGASGKRAERMVEALNSSMEYIFEQHPQNRVGVVTYSRGSSVVLNMGRYTADNNAFFYTDDLDITSGYQGTTISNGVHASASLSYEGGGKVNNVAGGNAIQGFGTYTQSGIARGYEVFRGVTDTTYTYTFNDGRAPRTVDRQPVFILLSDGEPTYSTNIFMDVLNGPHYGDGNGDKGGDNSKGIHGYYTILSANYYKDMTGIHYDRPALFYTVGMEIEETNDGPMISNSGTGDNYKRAVLNPTTTTLSAGSNIDYDGTIGLLKKLIDGSYTEQSYRVCETLWPESNLGVPHLYVPVLQNHPYEDDYSYADGAYFGTMETEDLTGIFNNIIKSSQKVHPYGFILYESSSVTMTDSIGEGMEIKGNPVLRFYGNNYAPKNVETNGNVTTYTYEGKVTDTKSKPNRTYDLSQISVNVTSGENGSQTVSLFIPDKILPTYTPSDDAARYEYSSNGAITDSMFYYEALPLRLIYQVGLTAKSEEDILNLSKNGGELTFYTNAFIGTDDSIAPSASTELIPSTANPFYNDVNNDGTVPPYQPHKENKVSNLTETAEYSVNCSMSDHDDDETINVIHTLGNNGKLVFAVDKQTVELPVEKKWESVPENDQKEVTVALYKVMETTSENGTSMNVELLEEAKINSTENWKHTFENLDTPDDKFYYAVRESDTQGFQAQYGNDLEIITLNLEAGPVQAVKITADFFSREDSENSEHTDPAVITITNFPGVELPRTGGPGTILYTAGGLMFIAAAFFLLFYNRKYQISSP